MRTPVGPSPHAILRCHTPTDPGICISSQRTTYSRMNASSPCQTTPQSRKGTSQKPSSFPRSRKNVSSHGQVRLDATLDTPPSRKKDGGARRDRTDDLLNANQALSQLSYGPSKMVGLGRLELPTSRLSSARSNQLSYKPVSIPASPPAPSHQKTRCPSAPVSHAKLVRKRKRNEDDAVPHCEARRLLVLKNSRRQSAEADREWPSLERR